MLDSCCISIGLVFIKDRPVSNFWVLRFRSRVLRFRVLGASFSRFGCFVLRSSFSSASFSELPGFPVHVKKYCFRGYTVCDISFGLHFAQSEACSCTKALTRVNA